MPSAVRRTPLRGPKVKLVKVEDDEKLECCYESEKCPLDARDVLKKRLFQHDNKFYLENFLTEQEA